VDENEIRQTTKIDRNHGEAVIVRSEEIDAYRVRTCKHVNVRNIRDVVIKRSLRFIVIGPSI